MVTKNTRIVFLLSILFVCLIACLSILLAFSNSNESQKKPSKHKAITSLVNSSQSPDISQDTPINEPSKPAGQQSTNDIIQKQEASSPTTSTDKCNSIEPLSYNDKMDCAEKFKRQQLEEDAKVIAENNAKYCAGFFDGNLASYRAQAAEEIRRYNNEVESYVNGRCGAEANPVDSGGCYSREISRKIAINQYSEVHQMKLNTIIRAYEDSVPSFCGDPYQKGALF